MPCAPFFRRPARRAAALAIAAGLLSGGSAQAAAFACGGFAMLGGAQLICSHTDPHAPAQTCTFSWALTPLAGGLSVQEGSFLLPPGATNATVYQGSGFAGELSMPIVLCQGKHSR